MTEEESKKVLAEIDLQMVRFAGFQDGYKAAIDYTIKLLKEKTDGAGIQANTGNPSSPS